MILDKIITQKRLDVAAAQQRIPLEKLKEQLSGTRSPLGFEKSLRRRQPQTAIIAEVKKGSPSKGLIRADFNPLEIAINYQNAGATCVSVLTDETFFYGHLDFLSMISAQVSLPVLRKDFMIDHYQIYEARAHGADAILLIVAVLGLSQLQEMSALAGELGMDVLMEVHNEQELDIALQTDCPLIGINNRCLKTFITDLATTERLLPRIPAHCLVVSESGIYSRSDIERLQQAGAAAFLIGESLMRESDYAGKLRELVGDVA